jgi:hypothetical protein
VRTDFTSSLATEPTGGTRNQALIDLRRFIVGFVEKIEPDMPQIWQWERHIEL